MRAFTPSVVLLTFAAVLAACPSLALKRVPYPEVKVIPLPAAEPDAALTAMRKRFVAAVQERDLDALTALVSSQFEWTAGGATVDEFDAKRGGEHNFKVAFGFRRAGADADGPTDIGPQWDLLSFFANDPILTREKGSELVCGSTTAKPADFALLDEAYNRIDEENDLSEWVYSIGELELTEEPDGKVITKVSNAALPILDVHPAQDEDAKEPKTPTHFELLLPDGKAGWAPVGKLRPLFVDRLCVSKQGEDWKIALYDQSE